MSVVFSIIAIFVSASALIVSTMRHRQSESDSLFAKQKTIIKYCADTVSTCESRLSKQNELKRAEEHGAAAMGMASSSAFEARLKHDVEISSAIQATVRDANEMQFESISFSEESALAQIFKARKMLRNADILDRGISGRFGALRKQSIELRREALALSHTKTSSYTQMMPLK